MIRDWILCIEREGSLGLKPGDKAEEESGVRYILRFPEVLGGNTVNCVCIQGRKLF